MNSVKQREEKGFFVYMKHIDKKPLCYNSLPISHRSASPLLFAIAIPPVILTATSVMVVFTSKRHTHLPVFVFQMRTFIFATNNQTASVGSSAIDVVAARDSLKPFYFDDFFVQPVNSILIAHKQTTSDTRTNNRQTSYCSMLTDPLFFCNIPNFNAFGQANSYPSA